MSMLKLGPVRQVAYVVKDIETAMQEWIKLGVGPWFYAAKVPVENFTYKGQPSDVQFAAALTDLAHPAAASDAARRGRLLDLVESGLVGRETTALQLRRSTGPVRAD